MKALLSILALYNYDNSIFDNLNLPEGVLKDDVVDNLLMELAELEVLYADPSMMKFAIGAWSKKELPIWEKLHSTTKLDYNPIFNQFRTEEYSDKEIRNLSLKNIETRDLSGTDSETRDLTASDNETRDLAETHTHNSTTTGSTRNDGTDTTKEYVSAFNEATPTLSKQTEQALGSGNSVNGTVTTTDSSTDKGTVNNALTDKGTVNKSMTDSGTVDRQGTDTGTIENIRTAKFEGHTGLIAAQKLIEMERDVSQFNIVSYIIESFKKRFCILIY